MVINHKKNLLIVFVFLLFAPIVGTERENLSDNESAIQESLCIQDSCAEQRNFDDTDKSKLLATITTLLSEPEHTISSMPQSTIPEEQCDIPLRSFPIQPKKHITFLTYMAADNNLGYFSKKNLDQQTQVGSNNFINIVTQLNTRLSGNQKISKTYFVKKDQLVILNDEHIKEKMDSGNPETLINFCRFAIKHFPADHYVLIIWNHGLGIMDIGNYSAFNASKLFRYNPETNMLDLDRSIPHFELLTQSLPDPRGICFDDSTGHYINNQGLEYALKTICDECLNGKKIDLIGFDACLMSMIEIGNILRDYAQFMVGSQEVELALGWRYDTILAKAAQQKIAIPHLAQHIVNDYREMYHKITKDYTQSAVALEKLSLLEENVSTVAQLLLQTIKLEKNNTVREALKASRHKLYCTHFVEQSFVDLHHFYTNLLNNMNRFQYNDARSGKKIQADLQSALQQGISLLQQIVIANVAGPGLAKARGISIYFPEQRIHGSYAYTKFAQTNSWSEFIAQYIQL